MPYSLLIRPKFDTATEYSYKWAEQIADETKEKFTLIDIGGRRVGRGEVEDAIRSKDPILIVFYDHGVENGWMGSESEAVIDVNNVGLLSGRIAYSMSCLSAKGLGVQAYRSNCKVFVGYNEEFVFTTQDEKIFGDCANYGLLLWLDGESNWATIKQKWIEFWNKMIDSASDPWTKMWLRHDRDILRIIAEGVDEPKETKCPVRALALKLFGTRLGWALTRKTGISILTLLAGLAAIPFSQLLGAALLALSYAILFSTITSKRR